MSNTLTEVLVFETTTIRTKVEICRGWFGCDWTLPEGTFLDFIKVDEHGRRVYKYQSSTMTLRYKKGDSAGFRHPRDCFVAVGF